MIKVLGLDPGKTTGWAMISVEDTDGGRIIIPTLDYGNTKDMTLGEIQKFLQEADCICFEGWRTFKKNAERGDLNFQKVYAEQVIGSMNTLIRVLGLNPKVHENLSAVKPVGYGYANMKYVPGKKGMHWQDALSHAVWFAVEKLKARPLG